MHDKESALVALRDIFDRWKDTTARLREMELTTPLADGLSVRDVVGHLRGWQQVTLARLEAARLGSEPVMPGWLAGGDPDTDSDELTDAYNAHLLAAYRSRPWSEVYRLWRDGFLRLLAAAEAIPAADLTEPGRYPWLGGHALIDVLHGTLEHHREHLEELS